MYKDQIDISIIVPVFNAELYLEQCIKSILNQSHKNIEVIAINDGSTDNSLELLRQFEKNDKRVKVINQKNAGVSQARNNGMDIAKGNYIMFVDSDDWLDLNICKILLENAIENDSDLIICAHYNVSSKNKIEKRIFSGKTILKDQKFSEVVFAGTVGLSNKNIRQPQKIDMFVPMWARLYKNKIIQDYKIRNYDYKTVPSECQLFNMEFNFRAKSLTYVDECLYYYRRDSNKSITKKYREGLLENWKNWNVIMLRFLKEIEAEDFVWSAYYNRLALSTIPLGGNALKKDSFIKVLKEMKKVLKSDLYISCFNYLQIKKLPIHWKLFFVSAKNKQVISFFILTKIMRMIIDSKK